MGDMVISTSRGRKTWLLVLLPILMQSCLLGACSFEGKYEKDGNTDPSTDNGSEPGRCTGVLYEEYFDSSNGFYAMEGARSSWDWGTASEGLGCRVGSCWATNPWGSYSICEDSTLTSPRIDLSACSGSTLPVFLTFWHWYDFEWNDEASACNDGVAVELSSDGGTNWEQIEPEGGWSPALNVPGLDCRNNVDEGFYARAHSMGGFDCYGSEIAWQHVRFLIPPALRTDDVRIRFVMGSTYEGHAAGYTLDEVEITAPGG